MASIRSRGKWKISVQVGAALCVLAGADTEGVFVEEYTASGADQQAGGSLSPDAADPRGAISLAGRNSGETGGAADGRITRVGGCCPGTNESQQGSLCAGQQAGPDLLCQFARWRGLWAERTKAHQEVGSNGLSDACLIKPGLAGRKQREMQCEYSQ
jgi:hypothetical protein